MSKYAKFESCLFDPKTVVIMFNNPKNGCYIYDITAHNEYFELVPRKEKRFINAREIIKFYKKEGFTTFNSVLDYIEKYF